MHIGQLAYARGDGHDIFYLNSKINPQNLSQKGKKNQCPKNKGEWKLEILFIWTRKQINFPALLFIGSLYMPHEIINRHGSIRNNRSTIDLLIAI
jgi:hypothetical protein